MPREIDRDYDVIDQESTTEVVVREPMLPAMPAEMTVDDLVAQNDKIQQAMERAMRPDHHYGVIPGTKKPTLLKPGAEKLCVLFRLAPSYVSEKVFHDDGHLTVIATCTLTHIPTGLVIASGEGLCSTREPGYAFRQGGRICPECGTDAIIRGKAEFGGGWLCFKRKGGCGAKWDDESEQAIVFSTAEVGRVPTPPDELAAQWNTVLKMADKRALIAGVLNGTAASDVFTQDMEDTTPGTAVPPAEPEPFDLDKFDPETGRHPGCPPSTQKGAKTLASMMNTVDPNIDWPTLGSTIIWSYFGKVRADLTPDEWADYTRRLGNMVAVLHDGMGGHDFPPPEFDEIFRGVAWAFGGTVVDELPMKDTEPRPEEGETDTDEPPVD